MNLGNKSPVKVDVSNKSQVNGDAMSSTKDMFQNLWNAKVVLATAVLALFVRLGYGSDSASPPGLASTYDISSNTDDYIGRTVTIISKPFEKVSSSSFTVSDSRFMSGEPFVVVNATGVPFDLPKNKDVKVQVTGQVRNLDIPQIERDYQLNLQDEYYKDHVNKPAIIAQEIIQAPTPGQITSKPTRFYGKTLAVRAEVDNVQSPALFTLDENYVIGAEDLLVFLKPEPQEEIKKAQTVMVMGELRPFNVNEIERAYNVRWDEKVKTQLDADYRNKPVLVADAIYP
ncbi:hypothetical protein WA1_11505 [Scytonema hofmannii PCC 7110]|uniref:Uncharacterized protein n=1 Tax=Scytonema hofmannii PCC 7110 TaxID=128403 RepID=A0A139XDK7_9CYAN|nr:hypothetical protein [Scytonema hofmannii]KYC42756.1 hypothetical protein WA1_11505 [Scytonema hofmannii PCC 7110]